MTASPLDLSDFTPPEAAAIETVFAAVLLAHGGQLEAVFDGADDLHAGIDPQGLAFCHVAGSEDSLPRTWRLSSAGELGEWCQLGPDRWDFASSGPPREGHPSPRRRAPV
jgi:hypothetical protein